MPRYWSEFIGTFALVFVGTGAIASDAVFGGVVSSLGVALAFGLTVMIMIYAVGDVSGAHFNPAVSLGFWWAGRLERAELGRYVGSQAAGEVAASLCLRVLLPESPTLGVTLPQVALGAAFAVEVAISFLLMFVILQLVLGSPSPKGVVGAAVGATIVCAALFAGPLTGASMNPARSLGPALVSGQLEGLWLFLLAPPIGALLAVQGCRATRSGDCCRAGS